MQDKSPEPAFEQVAELVDASVILKKPYLAIGCVIGRHRYTLLPLGG